MQDMPALTWQTFFGTWDFRLGWTTAALVLLVAYIGGVQAARHRGQPGVPAYRIVSFVLGLALMAYTVNSAVETYSHVLFWMHMIEHLLMIMVVPALLVVGHPLTVAVQALPPDRGQRLRDLLVSWPVAVLTHPAVGLIVYAAVLVGTHLTGFMEQMLTHMWVHDVENVLYLVAGLWFLLPVLGNEPIRWRPPLLLRMFVLFLAMAPDTVVGVVLLQTDHVLFPALAANHQSWAPSVVHDINKGGGIMWAGGDGLMMAFIVGCIVVYITHTASNATSGTWLESVRRNTMAGNISASGGDAHDFDSDRDLDDDEASLQAYNDMLRRLNERGRYQG
ncbi:MAG: cytochrome c oxidase assembly protein [Nocardioidaceae bacterium]